MLFPGGLLSSCLRRQRLLMIPSLKGLPIKGAEINQGDELELELELELIQYQMTQRPMLLCEVGARSLRASSHA